MFDETKFMIDNVNFEDDMDDVGPVVENISDDTEEDGADDVVDKDVIVTDMSGFNVADEDFDNSDGQAEVVETICEDEDAEENIVDEEDYAITCSVNSATEDTLDDVDD